MEEATFSVDTLLGLPERGAGALEEGFVLAEPGEKVTPRPKTKDGPRTKA
jgi:hypothetical protein